MKAYPTLRLLCCLFFSGSGLYAQENTSTFEETYRQALVAFNSKNYEESLEHVRKIIKNDLKNPRLRYLAAHSYWKLKKYDISMAHFKAFLEAEPEDPAGYVDLALMFLEEGNYKSSRETAIQGMEALKRVKKPVAIKFFNIIARTYLYEKNLNKTLEYIQLAKGKFSETDQRLYSKVETLLLEARSYLLSKQFAKSEIAILWAQEMFPGNRHTLNLLGLLYTKWAQHENNAPQKQKLLKKAKENFEKALDDLDGSSPLYNIIQKNLDQLST